MTDTIQDHKNQTSQATNTTQATPVQLEWILADDKSELAEVIAQKIEHDIRISVEKQGRASLLLSGGSTPQEAYQLLAKAPLPWEQMQVSLTDERRVVDGHPASNAVMIWQRLLARHPQVQWFPLWQTGWNCNGLSELKAKTSELQRPFDLTLLGMGEDGHFASLFPGCAASLTALESRADQLLCTQASSDPRDRISWSMDALIESKNLMLYVTGERKKAVIEAALIEGTPEYKFPIGYLFRAVAKSNKKLRVFWAP